MANIPPTPIDAVTSRWATWSLSAQRITARNKEWPRPDGGAWTPNPDEVWLLDVEHLLPEHAEYTAEPTYDGRLFVLAVADQNDPSRVDVDNFRLNVAWTQVPRPASERAVYAHAEEEAQFVRHLSPERFMLRTALVVGILINFTVDGQTIPTKWRPYIEKYRDMVKNKILPNRLRLEDLYAAFESELDANISAGWTTPDPTLDPDPAPPSDA